MKTIDLRSDTVTKPTPEMLKAIVEAKLGDDVFGEDPTVNRLEETAAKTLGKEAALFVASGTMGNLICQLAHCNRGDEMIVGDKAHIFFYEQGSSAAVGGIHSRTVPNLSDGTMQIKDIEHVIRGDDIHYPRTRLIVLENTHNLCNGSPLGAEYMRSIGKLAKKHGLKIHLDGARLFHAAAALKINPAKLTADADSVSICLSKGLAAPVGSVVCGTRKFINKARRSRKLLGGGMRQAGVLAAPGILALTEMTKRLSEDHANAKILAHGLASIDERMLDPESIKTNIVYFNTPPHSLSAVEMEKRLYAEGIRTLPFGPNVIRAVTHYHIKSKDIEHVLSIIKKILRH